MKGSVGPRPPLLRGHPGAHRLPSPVSLRFCGLRITHIAWVLTSRLSSAGSLAPGLLCLPNRAEPPSKPPGVPSASSGLLSSVFPGTPSPRPHPPSCSESALRACYFHLSSGNLSHCKPTPSLKRNLEDFKTINKLLPLAEDRSVTN